MSGRKVIFVTKDDAEILTIDPPPGWALCKKGADGASWTHAKRRLSVIASIAIEGDGRLWLHVSVAHFAVRRMPTYEDLADIKRAFVGTDRYAIQVFPPAALHVNLLPNCLHLFSCMSGHPLPEFSAGGVTI